MKRLIRLSVVMVLALAGAVALPAETTHAASLGYTFTNLHHPKTVRSGTTYSITGTMVDSSDQGVANTAVYVARVEPAKTCDPAACVSSAFTAIQTDAHGNFTYGHLVSTLDTAYVLYPPDDSFAADVSNAVEFAVHTHNQYRWSGPKSVKLPVLVTSSIGLNAKKSTIAPAAGAATPRAQVRKGHGKWRTLKTGSVGGLFAGTFSTFGEKLPILGASKPGHYSVRLADVAGKYEDAARSPAVGLTVTKRHIPPWLARTNHYRHSVGLQPFFEDKKFDKWDRLHARWTAHHHVLCHCEDPSTSDYTKKGDTAGANSVIELGVGNQVGAVDLWIGAPFHATCLLNPDVSIAGFGIHQAAAAEWCLPSRQVFDVASKTGNVLPNGGRAFTFPSRHMKVPTSLLTNQGETPDPRESCKGGWSSWSVPVLFRIPHPIGGDPKIKHFKTSLTRNGHRVGPECAFSGSTFHSPNGADNYLVSSILAEGPWVILLVRPSLQRGATYKATFKDGHYKQATTFTVAH